MQSKGKSERRARIKVNLLGNISKTLTELQGFESMAREIIQNADDAEAKELRFSIEPNFLRVWNDAEFSNCGDLLGECLFKDRARKRCDFHAISEIASGNKSRDSSSTGRFGVGFVSVYQVTDKPIISSGTAEIELDPANGDFGFSTIENQEGSEFRLPWAVDPESPMRQEIDYPAITPEDLDTVAADFVSAAKNCLFFLRNLSSIEIIRDGVSLIRAVCEPAGKNRFQVSYEPEGRVEEWYVIGANADKDAAALKEEYQALEEAAPQTDLQIAFNLSEAGHKDGVLKDGLLFAYLPTEEKSPIPCHINADFFPQANRKSLVFSGGGGRHRRYWNEMLLRVAAKATAEHLIELRDILGAAKLWSIIDKAWKQRGSEHFKCFWEKISEAAAENDILRTSGEEWSCVKGGVIPQSAIPQEQARSLIHIGVNLVHESLRPFFNVLRTLEVRLLTLDSIIGNLETWSETQLDTDSATARGEFKNLVEPLWAVTDSLVDKSSEDVLSRLQKIGFAPKTGGSLVPIEDLYRLPEPISNEGIEEFINDLPLVDQEFKKYGNLYDLVDELSLQCFFAELAEKVKDQKSAREFFGSDVEHIRRFYKFLSGYPRFKESVDASSVSESPILAGPDNKFFTPAEAVWPGGFSDPVGRFNTLDVSYFDDRKSEEFLKDILGVTTLTFRFYIKKHLEGILAEGLSDEQYTALSNQLIAHPELLDDEEIGKKLRDLPVIKTMEGDMRRPNECYFKTEELTELLGEQHGAWIDSNLCESTSGRIFLDKLGVRRTLSLEHALEKIEEITAEPPSKDAIHKISNLFNFVFRLHRDNEIDKDGYEIDRLRSIEWLPALYAGDLDMDNWHAPNKIYQPFRAHGFGSQSPVLAMRVRDGSFLKFLSMPETPPTSAVVSHLLHCAEQNKEANRLTYQILDEKLSKGDDVESIKTLRLQPCIYSADGYVAANRVFWEKPGLYSCFTAPHWMHGHKQFFDFLGVQEEPDQRTYINVLIDIAKEFGRQSSPPPEKVKMTHGICLNELAREIRENRSEMGSLLDGLGEHPFFLSMAGTFIFPHEAAVNDNKWLAEPFGAELEPRFIEHSSEYSEILKWFEVKALSDVVRLNAVDLGEGSVNQNASEKLRERSELLLWLFEKPRDATRKKIAGVLNAVEIIHVDCLRVESVLTLNEEIFTSDPKQERAFFDKDSDNLYLDHDPSKETWYRALRAVFFTVLSVSDGVDDIKNLTGIAEHVMCASSFDGAHQYLVDRDYSPPDSAPEHVEFEEVSLGGIPDGPISEESADSAEPENQEKSAALSGVGAVNSTSTKTSAESAPKNNESGKPENASGLAGAETGAAKSKPSEKSKTQNQRTQWMRSYVKPRSNEAAENSSGSADRQEKNPEIDEIGDAAELAVVEYEEDRGCNVQRMPPKNPGYDIRSEDAGEIRFIEVKGRKEEWGKRGVKVSQTQMKRAQKEGEKYWLYVVEYALDKKKRKIYPIRNPFHKTDEFWFDDAWREVSEQVIGYEARFIPGRKVQVENFGKGTIVSVEEKGMSAYSRIVIDFPSHGKKVLELKISSMELVED